MNELKRYAQAHPFISAALVLCGVVVFLQRYREVQALSAAHAAENPNPLG